MANLKLIIAMTAATALTVLAVRTQALPAIVSTDISSGAAKPFTKADALNLVRTYDANYFNGWFSTGGRKHKDVMAIFAVESGFNPKAYNPNDISGAWGLGQMLATTANDFGVSNPQNLFNPQIAVRATMDYLIWAYDYLTNRLGRVPSRDEWIGSYNAGVGAVSQGRIPTFYLLKWQAARVLV